MDPIRNPFVPGAGAQPPELTGREEILAQAATALGRVRIGRGAKSFIGVGLRGVGKTVLLNRVRAMATGMGYRTIFVEATEQRPLASLLLPHLRRLLLDLDRLGALNETVKRSLRIFKGFMSAIKLRYGDAELALDIDPEVGTADSGDLENDLAEMFAAAGKAAAARNAAVLLILDEIQYLGEPDMNALIMALHRVAQDGLPLLMVGAGLPQVVGLSGRAKSYAERLFDFPPLEALTPADARRALQAPAEQEGAHFTAEALDDILRITEGYPYFLQEWGYHVWNTAQSPLIGRADVDAAMPLALRRLDEGFFRVRLDRLTPRERDYLRAMAAIGPGPHRSGDVALRLGVSVQSVAPLRSALIGKGMVYSPAHGDTAFTVPLFDAFMRRAIPEWHPTRRAGPARAP